MYTGALMLHIEKCQLISDDLVPLVLCRFGQLLAFSACLPIPISCVPFGSCLLSHLLDLSSLSSAAVVWHSPSLAIVLSHLPAQHCRMVHFQIDQEAFLNGSIRTEQRLHIIVRQSWPSVTVEDMMTTFFFLKEKFIATVYVYCTVMYYYTYIHI